MNQNQIDAKKQLEELLADNSLYHLNYSHYHLFIHRQPAKSTTFFDPLVRTTLTCPEMKSLLAKLLMQKEPESQRFLYELVSRMNMEPVWLNTACAYGKNEVLVIHQPAVEGNRILPYSQLNEPMIVRYPNLDDLKGDEEPVRKEKEKRITKFQETLLDVVFGNGEALRQLSRRFGRCYRIYASPTPTTEDLILPTVLFCAKGSQLHIDLEYTSSHAQVYNALRANS